MYYWKVFLWENGKKSVEYTDFCLAPIYYEDRLDETLDTGEIILEIDRELNYQLKDINKNTQVKVFGEFDKEFVEFCKFIQ